MRWIAAAVLCALTAAGCTARPGSDTTNADPAAPTPPAPAPRVLGSCCPDIDAELTALIQRYERTPERERPAEVALWPYRMTSGIPGKERIIVRDSASWSSLWPRIVGTHSPVPPVPAVDFASQMLLVVSMGTRSSGGYIIMIDSVRVQGDTVRVAVREQSPGPRCGTPAVITAPVGLARIERTELPVSFVTRETVRDCT